MKKRNLFIAVSIIIVIATGCSTQRDNSSDKVSTKAVSVSVAEVESTSDSSSTEMENTAGTSTENDVTKEKGATITGTISDIKDFMFIITDKNGVAYVLSFDGEKPKGLSDVKEGDTVTVAYTGELEETEAFTGTVISVTKN